MATSERAQRRRFSLDKHMINRIHAFVMTSDRKAMLLENLDALLAQTEPLTSIIVVDNGSTDGTRESLAERGFLDDPRFVYLRINARVSPAAGLNRGLNYAFEQGIEWLWVVYDDVLPAPDALANLKAAFNDNFSSPLEVGFLASHVFDPEGEPLNPPIGGIGTGKLLGKGILKVRSASLASCLIPFSTIRDFGVLNRDLHKFGEDTEFTLRVTEDRASYLVGSSRVTFLSAPPANSILAEKELAAIAEFYYWYRNAMYIRRRFLGWQAVAAYFVTAMRQAAMAAAAETHGARRMRAIMLGTIGGLVFTPRPWAKLTDQMIEIMRQVKPVHRQAGSTA